MCTGVRFTDADGNLYFGRNLDWTVDYGEKVTMTPAGFTYQTKFGAPDGKRAVLGMGITCDGIPLYFDCANENGLAVGGLNFPGYAQYEEGPVDGKTNVAAYEFPFWIARNFDTVDEAEAALKDVAIVGVPVSDEYPVSMLHWIIADKDRSIIVEYMADGLHLYHNPVDVLTNQPTFGYHLENLRNYMGAKPEFPATETWDKLELTPWGSGTSMFGLPGDYSSPSRFVRAAYANAHYPDMKGEKDNVQRLLKTLQNSAFILGGAEVAGGQFEKTIYSSCYSALTNTYYYNTYEDYTVKAHALSDFDLTSDQIQQAA
ncbi:choloylglycine hydrolase [Bifidobacterium gallicum]|uniref:choloylglycine hydrolase n=2 Tax=Bifidobacterium gallicum DSM 20093 = LMG 11596 TaxID=561180 RepID=D1NSI6_9BIFI|nr:choloylglycine hydrolase [Bifidobacterium gallicum]EFA23638.1 linear amide C-N hydrolase, choloylglycine hydrolase family protein [Bifidobacterium gallicum DSM 20093 = LMG 11596]KFI58699.1 choloylglycine hydrolase [Bifidobacterium gallicum DSM 20093 = LMG 11596]